MCDCQQKIIPTYDKKVLDLGGNKSLSYQNYHYFNNMSMEIMMKNKFPNNSLLVIADGTQAALFRNVAKDGSLSLVAKERLMPLDLEDDGPAGKMPSDMSKPDLDEATFAKQLTTHLNAMAETGQIQHIVLVADPTTLGQIRGLMSKRLNECVLAEQPKTLTTSTIEDIERSLSSD
ncbi:MAG: protein required for attachment to host cells [Granulosicoccus sp.]|jgi:protein required for attachment to host cells